MVAMNAEIILTAACGARSTVRRAETIYYLRRPMGVRSRCYRRGSLIRKEAP
jgi:hypothetical protein